MILMDCNDIVLGSILVILRNILDIIWIVGPILAIVSLIINITLLMKDPDDKKVPKKIKNSILALVLLFFVPTIVNAAMYMLGENTIISSCLGLQRCDNGRNNGSLYRYLDGSNRACLSIRSIRFRTLRCR